MIELLKLCGYSKDEIATELPRVEKAFNRMQINDEDLERGRQRLTKYYDMELEGLRRVFRLIMQELIDAVMARDEGRKKLIYGFMAPGMDLIAGVMKIQSKDIFALHHCWAFQVIMGCVFDKIVPAMEEAEKKWLKAGMVAHCANIKSFVGAIELGYFPKPDLLITSGLTCETSPKTMDLLHEFYDIPTRCFDFCQDREFEQFPEPSQRIAELTAKSLRRLVESVHEATGIEITDDKLQAVMEAKGKINEALQKIRDLVANSNPLPLSPTHENIWMCLNALTLDFDEIGEATNAVNQMYEELRAKVDKGIGVVEKDAPRVLAILPAGQTDPRLEHLACEAGIAIVSIDMNFFTPFNVISQDPYMQFGFVSQQHSLGFTLRGRIPLILDACKKLRVDGVLDRYHVGCRSVVADALVIKETVQKELGIPVLELEWENFDPRVFNKEDYLERFEIFKSMMV